MNLVGGGMHRVKEGWSGDRASRTLGPEAYCIIHTILPQSRGFGQNTTKN